MYYSSSNDSRRSNSSEEDNFRTYKSNTRRNFVFPPAPRLCRSANNTCDCSSTSNETDSSFSDGRIEKSRRRARKKGRKSLPPIGVFWDIENCQVPKNKSAMIIVQSIRERLFKGYREAEFLVVCDVKKENAQVIQDLHDAQINLIHVSATSKNAADEKLRQSLRRFAEIYPPPSAVVLISSDVNFASDLSDLRYRKKIHVILVHNSNVADALILCANETFNYAAITETIPVVKFKNRKAPSLQQVDIKISNLPLNYNKNKLINRLKQISSNCGGRVVFIDCDVGNAVLRFPTYDYALRAQKRLRGEDVFGYKINASDPNTPRESPSRNFTARKMKHVNGQTFQNQHATSFSCLNSALDAQSFQYKAQDLSYPHQMDTRTSFQQLNSQYLPKRQNEVKSTNSVNFTEQCLQEESRKNGVPIELLVSNFDTNIDIESTKTFLTNLLKELVMLISINFRKRVDGNYVAFVKVWNQVEAQTVISQLHHYKLGFKRLNVSYVQKNNLDPSYIREIVISLLLEFPECKLPLFKFINLLEKHFHVNVSISEIYKLTDICKIIEDECNGRFISLHPEIENLPLSFKFNTLTYKCPIHSTNGIEASTSKSEQPIYIMISLKIFSNKLLALLSSHNGSLPLLSFSTCYEAEFNEQLPMNPLGVPLEHLVTCVPNVELKYGGPMKNIKYVTLVQNSTTEENSEKTESCLRSPCTTNIQRFCRELVDLLKTMERCQLPLGKFIPRYHHHFGHQCRVADYGFTKLVDLLSYPVVANYIQILGNGTRRIITLTHSTQMRRFTSDLLRILKNQVWKQVTLTEFSSVYERVIGRPFNPVDYGLCTLEDLFDNVSKNTVVINKLTVAIPKREQTAQEIMLTKHFAEEVVELLREMPQCSMSFQQFAPTYHHHFRCQCRVSDYGFSKLIELFEAISDTVRIEEMEDGERMISLTLPRLLQVLGEQIVKLVKSCKDFALPLEALPVLYVRKFNYQLELARYECSRLDELITKLEDYVKLQNHKEGSLIVLSDSKQIMSMRFLAVLLKPVHILPLKNFITRYSVMFNTPINRDVLEKNHEAIDIKRSSNEDYVALKPFYILASNIYHVLFENGGTISLNQLEYKYKSMFNKPLCALNYNYNSIEELIADMKFLISIRYTKRRVSLILKETLPEHGIPLPWQNSGNQETIKKYNSQESWSSLYSHYLELCNYGNCKISPPKPDTPQSPTSEAWYKWDGPSGEHSNLSINLPVMEIPKFSKDMLKLISPEKTLLPAYDFRTAFTAPEPEEVPIPDKLFEKAAVSDDSEDSGVINNSNVVSENETDISSDNHGAKRKVPMLPKRYLTYEF